MLFRSHGVLPNIRRTADLKFGQKFSYLLDGTPVAADICPGAAPVSCTSAQWRTLLVGGLGAAGREFYALDITDPANPSALWRFNADSDGDLGYAQGRPLVTKRRDGRWIVVLTSGYNNVQPGSGRGFLFVLDAYTGELLTKIDTGAPAGTPSGTTTAPDDGMTTEQVVSVVKKNPNVLDQITLSPERVAAITAISPSYGKIAEQLYTNQVKAAELGMKRYTLNAQGDTIDNATGEIGRAHV